MTLENKKIAILATHGFEKSELFEPLKILKKEGATIHIVSNEKGEIKSWDHNNWGISIPVDKLIEDAKASDYDALLLPGGVLNPDKLRTDEKALKLIKSFVKNKKPVAAICHAPWLLISAGVIDNKKITSYKSIKDDVINAGGKWVDKEVVADGGLITSRNPKDIPAFTKKLIDEIKIIKHEKQTVSL